MGNNKNQDVKDSTYWYDLLENIDENTILFEHDFERTAVNREKFHIEFELPNDVRDQLLNLANNSDLNLYVLLVSIFNVLVYKLLRQDTIITKSPYYSQDQKNSEDDRVLFFVSEINDEYSFKEYLTQVKEKIIEAYNYQEQLNPILTGLKKMNETHIFSNVECRLNNIHEKRSTCPEQNIIFEFTRIDKTIKSKIIADSDIEFDYYYQELPKQFINCAQAAINNLDIQLNKIDILTDNDKTKLLSDFNNNKVPLDTKSLVEIIEENVVKYPHKIAIKCLDQCITYDCLNQKANQLSRVIHKRNIKADNCIGILLDRSIEFIVSILAIWKSGGAYLPLNTENPDKRILELVEMANCKLIISKTDLLEPFLKDSINEILVDLEDTLIYEHNKEKSSNLNIPIQLNNLAYILFTSGSTGKPKGVMVEHLGMKNHMQAKITDLNLTQDSNIAQTASQLFDISVWQFIEALTVGGTTIVYTDEVVLDQEKMIKGLIKDMISIYEIVPSYLKIMLGLIEKKKLQLNDLKYIIITGETVSYSLVNQWFELFPKIKVVNAYGPSEASDDITEYVMDESPKNGRVYIGKSIQNLNLYVLDKDLQLCPIGTKGEICVSGVGVGRGYINDKARTKKVFQLDPFLSETPTRFYRTGDLGRFLPDGNLEFYGRKDYQVKINGARIELGEIEKKMSDLPQIKDNAVVVYTDNDNQRNLHAFYVAEPPVDPANVKKYLTDHLPNFMIPPYFSVLDEMPVTRNGKIDRKKLTNMKPVLSMKTYVAPKSEEEKIVSDVWKNLLKLDEVGITDNFFDLGGNSMKIIQLGNLLQDKLNQEFPIVSLFEHTTISDFLNFINQLNQEEISLETDSNADEQTSSSESEIIGETLNTIINQGE